MAVFTDQTGKQISLPYTPKRIVSVVPSQTELLYDLGLDDEVCGITRFCVHPDEWFRNKTRVGGTKQLNIDMIKAINPDLVIANKEENVKEQIEELEKYFPVWTSDVNDLTSAGEMITQVGKIIGKENVATQLLARIREGFSQLPTVDCRLRTAYLIWKDPYMTAGGDTFINSMLEAAGFENIFASKTRYPEININDLPIAHCQLLLLSSEPYPFKEKHADELQAQLPGVKIMLVDGEMFSWYGSRLSYAPGYFIELRNRLSLSSEGSNRYKSHP